MDHAEHGPLKRPHEDVTGTDRSGSDLLSIVERALEHRDALIAMARVLHNATLVGNRAPIVERIYDRIHAPVVGDLVVETSRALRAQDDNRITGFGILVAERIEWWEVDAEWEALKAEDGTLTDEDRRVDHAWYIQYGPAASHICRWVNCEFMTLPIGIDFAKPPGLRNETGTITITRNTLVGSLTDSGFALRDPQA